MTIIEERPVTDTDADPITADEELAKRDRMSRTVATTRSRREARIANAKKPGQALTIDEVLERGSVSGATATKPRRAVLEFLVSVGGTWHGPLDKMAKAMGLSESRSLSGLLQSMVKDSQVGVVKVHARKVERVHLVDPLVGDVAQSADAPGSSPGPATGAGSSPAVPTKAKPPTRKKQPQSVVETVPLPPLGSHVRVVGQFLVEEPDGSESIKMVFDGAQGRYGTMVEGFNAKEIDT